MESGCWGVPGHGREAHCEGVRTARGWEGERPLTRRGPGPASGKAYTFSGSCQSPGVGELMATNLLVSLPQTPRLPPLGSGRVLSPATSWGLWTSAGRRDSAQRQWERDAGEGGDDALSPGLAGRKGTQRATVLPGPSRSLLGALLMPSDLPRTSLLAQLLFFQWQLCSRQLGECPPRHRPPSFCRSHACAHQPSSPGRLPWRVQTQSTARLQAGWLPSGSSPWEPNNWFLP